MEKVSIITGAAAGIGRELAIQLYGKGHRVIGLDIDLVGLNTLPNEIDKRILDVTNYDSVYSLFSDIFEKYGRLDYVFANAGIAVSGEIRDVKIDQWKRIIDINILGVINCATVAYKFMINQGFGHIINTASLAGLLPSVTIGAYSTTKFAVVGFSRVLKTEAKNLGVNVSVICPGYIKSNIYESSIYNNVDKDAALSLNPFKLMETAEAVSIIIRKVEANKEMIVFPFYGKFTWFMYRFCFPVFNLLNKKLLSDFRKIRQK